MKETPAKNSTKKYWKDIFFLQFLHLPFKIRKESNGIFSVQFIFFLQFGQKDLPEITSLFIENL